MVPDAPIFFSAKKNIHLFIMWHLHHFKIYILQKICYSYVFECSPILVVDFLTFALILGGKGKLRRVLLQALPSE
jgi:hypothetical protein